MNCWRRVPLLAITFKTLTKRLHKLSLQTALQVYGKYKKAFVSVMYAHMHLSKDVGTNEAKQYDEWVKTIH